MYGKMQEFLSQTLAEIKEAGLYKEERLIESAQQAAITVKGKEVLNFCANNYLGLSNHPRLIKASQEMMNRRGYGMSSVRFICGTQDIHKELEAAISDYFQTEDTILYAACFDANGGVFEPLFTEEDAIISDSLNHASIIDGVRLCKAKRYRYANADMKDLERCLQEAQAQRFRIVVTDGVFSMDGNVAPMDQICDLAEKYDALVMVDESHSAGVVGATGHGANCIRHTAAWISTPERWAKLSVVRWEDLRQAAKRLSTCCVNAAVRICSLIHWLRVLSAPALKYSKC
jgi:glycine C-acetyltransferase